MTRVPDKILEAVRAHSMIAPGGAVVVALSGGGDSVALLRALHELTESGRLDARLGAAHLNHCLRSEDSDADAAFCDELAARLGIDIVSGQSDVRALARERGAGIEEVARVARMEFLARTAASRGADAVALGHTLDDQAETVLFRAIRGTGLDGLGGMRPVQEWRAEARRVSLIRPMLALRRDELRAYLRELGQDWREDSTNLDTAYSRNAVRLAVLPGAEKINPRAAEALARLAELARRAADHLADEADRALEGALREDGPGGGVSADADALSSLPGALRDVALRRLVRLATGSTDDLGFDAVERLAGLLAGETGRRVELPGGAVAERSYDRLALHAEGQPDADAGEWSVELAVPGGAELPAGGRIEAEVLAAADAAGREHGGAVEHLDYDAIGAPDALTVRSRREGDRLSPLGLGGTKKVKDLLIDGKVPARERGRVPVVLAGERIVWVAPYRMEDSAKVTPATVRVLRLSFTRGTWRPPAARRSRGPA